MEWEADDPQCKGGYDKSYRNEYGHNIRAACRFFQSCGSVYAQAQAAQRPIPAQSLVRTPPAPVQPSVASQYQAAQAAPTTRWVPPAPTPPPAPPPAPLAQVPVGYQQMMPVNYQMPGYLTAPEVQQEQRGFLGHLAANIIRSIGKATGHAISHTFDTTPLPDLFKKKDPR